MPTLAFSERRARLTDYFDRTAADAWARLTSDAPVSRIRETVRAGRARMRALLLERLGGDLHGRSVLDAGCGTGALAVEAARKGANVTAVDVAGNLVAVAAERAGDTAPGRVHFSVGDMLDPALGEFDHAVAMDSLIHYPKTEIARALAALAPRIRRSILFTFAPATPALSLMHAAGGLFPRADRAPAIEPVSEAALRRALAAEPALAAFALRAVERVQAGFYISHAMELARA